MKCFLHLRPSSSLLFAKRAASLQMRQFGVTITQSSGSGSGSEAGPGSGSSLLEAAAALEMVRLGRSPPVQFVDASWYVPLLCFVACIALRSVCLSCFAPGCCVHIGIPIMHTFVDRK